MHFTPTSMLKDILYLIEHVKSLTSFNDPCGLDLWRYVFLSNLVRNNFGITKVQVM